MDPLHQMNNRLVEECIWKCVKGKDETESERKNRAQTDTSTKLNECKGIDCERDEWPDAMAARFF